VKKPEGFMLPSLDFIEKELPGLIAAVRAENKFNESENSVTIVTYEK